MIGFTTDKGQYIEANKLTLKTKGLAGAYNTLYFVTTKGKTYPISFFEWKRLTILIKDGEYGRN